MNVIFWIIMGLLPIGLGYISFNRSIEIKYTNSVLYWPTPIIWTTLICIFAFYLEYFISWTVIHYFAIIDKAYFLFVLINNGFLIIIISPILSILLEKQIEAFNLDYLDKYSETVSKVIFSVIIIFFCFEILFNLNLLLYRDDSNVFILNRVVMWLMLVLGTWIGIGFKCDGRINRENKVIQRAKTKFFSRDNIYFWSPIVGYLAIFCVLIHISIRNYNSFWNYMGIGSIIFGISVFLLLVCINVFIEPSAERSRRKLYVLANKVCENQLRVSGRFHKMKYSLDKNFIYIDEIKIKYQGHENDLYFKELFDAKKYKYESPEDLTNFMMDRSNRQVEYIRSAFQSCKEEQRKLRMRFE